MWKHHEPNPIVISLQLPSSEDDLEANDNDEVLLLANEEAMGQTLVSADEQTTSNDVKILNPFEDAGGYHDDSDDDLLAWSIFVAHIFLSFKMKLFLSSLLQFMWYQEIFWLLNKNVIFLCVTGQL